MRPASALPGRRRRRASTSIDLHDQRRSREDPKRGKIVTVKRRARVYKFAELREPPDRRGARRRRSRSTLLPGSYALLDFGSFTRQADVSGNLRGYIPGRFKPNTDVQVYADQGRDHRLHRRRLHRRRLQRAGLDLDPHRATPRACCSTPEGDQQRPCSPAALATTAIVYTPASSSRSICATTTRAVTTRYVTTGYGRVHADVLLPRQGRPQAGLARPAGQLTAGHPERRRLPRAGHPDPALQRLPGAGPDHGQRQDDVNVDLSGKG